MRINLTLRLTLISTSLNASQGAKECGDCFFMKEPCQLKQKNTAFVMLNL